MLGFMMKSNNAMMRNSNKLALCNHVPAGIPTAVIAPRPTAGGPRGPGGPGLPAIPFLPGSP